MSSTSLAPDAAFFRWKEKHPWIFVLPRWHTWKRFHHSTPARPTPGLLKGSSSSYTWTLAPKCLSTSALDLGWQIQLRQDRATCQEYNLLHSHLLARTCCGAAQWRLPTKLLRSAVTHSEALLESIFTNYIILWKDYSDPIELFQLFPLFE